MPPWRRMYTLVVIRMCSWRLAEDSYGVVEILQNYECCVVEMRVLVVVVVVDDDDDDGAMSTMAKMKG